jgi:Leucine-rich repeat (LRR) protein
LGNCTVLAQNIVTKLDNYEYTDLNEALKNPDKVYRLNLSNQQFKEFPAGILKFKNLEYLNLRNDGLATLSPEIGNLKSLRVLDLGGNDFKRLPKDFVKLRNLEELFLDNDKNLDLKQDIDILSKLPKLRVLHLDNDGIGILPANISKLQYLDSLTLSNNMLKVIPPQVRGMKNLKFLDINHNHLPINMHLNYQPEYGLKIKF